MDWLEKLLKGIGITQGANPITPGKTPSFNPNATDPRVVAGTPLHTSVPDPDRPPFMQVQGQYGTIPTDEPSNAVPSSPPKTVTGNVPVNLEDALATARGDFQTAVSGPAHKQNPWMQALYLGLQGVQRVADPTNPANAQPVKWLGEAKRDDRIRKAGERLAPLEAQNERIIGERHKQAQTQTIYDDDARQRADLRRKIEKDEATTRYWNRKADQNDLKIAGDEELRILRDKWATSKDANDKRRLSLVEKEMANRTDRANAANKSREKIANIKETGLRTRQQVSIEAKKEAASIRAADAKAAAATTVEARATAAAAAQAARERLLKLKAEYEALQ